MKCSKLIGVVMGIVMVAGMAQADAKSDFEAVQKAYYVIGGDKAKAAQIQAQFEALPETAQTLSFAGYCLTIQGKNAEAIEKFYKSLKLATKPNDVLNLNGNIAAAYYALGQYDEGIKIIKTAIANGKDAHIKCQIGALGAYARGLTTTKRYAEAAPVIVEIIIAGVRLNGTVDAETVKWFDKIHPEALTAEVYKAALSDIIKAVPATEANTEFLGRVKSELEKMK